MFELGMFAWIAVLAAVLYMFYDYIQWGLDETKIRNTEDKNIWKKIFGGK